MIDVILPVAGKATRMKLLKHYRKPFLPVNNKHLITHVFESFSNIDVNTRFVVGEDDDEFARELVEECERCNIEASSVHIQRKLDGPLGAVRNAIHDISDDSDGVLIHLGDMFVTSKWDFTKDFLSVQKVDDFSRWCMVDEKLNFYDKPKTRPNTNLALSGVYFFKDVKLFKACMADVFQTESPKIGGEYQISQLLEMYTKDREMDLVELEIVDVGTIDDFLNIAEYTIARSFNEIIDLGDYIVKRSTSVELIKEAMHMKYLEENSVFSIPTIGDIHGKFIYDSNMCSYSMEKVPGRQLDKHFLFEEKSLEYFEWLFNKLFNYVNQVGRPGNISLDEKCKDLETVLYSRGLVEFIPLLDYVDSSSVITHGDFHLGNLILNDDGEVYAIDASGRFIHVRDYDLAKLIHGIVYNYHCIKMGLYLVDDDEHTAKIYNDHVIDRIELFIDMLYKEFDSERIKSAKTICCLLFKTMQGLHTEEEHTKIFEGIHKQLLKEVDEGDFDIRSMRSVNL